MVCDVSPVISEDFTCNKMCSRSGHVLFYFGLFEDILLGDHGKFSLTLILEVFHLLTCYANSARIPHAQGKSGMPWNNQNEVSKSVLRSCQQSPCTSFPVGLMQRQTIRSQQIIQQKYKCLFWKNAGFGCATPVLVSSQKRGTNFLQITVFHG